MNTNNNHCFPNCLYVVQPEDSSGVELYKKQKDALHTYKTSLKSLNNQHSVHILKRKLDLLNGNTHDDRQIVYQKLNSKDLFSFETKSFSVENFRDINVKELVKPLNCCKNDLKCKKSENVSREGFDHFTSLLYSNMEPQSIQEPVKVKKNSFFQSNMRNKTGLNMDKNIYSNNKPSNTPKETFMTAKELFVAQNKETGNKESVQPVAAQKRKFGPRRSFSSKFVSPLLSNIENNKETTDKIEEEVDERLKNIDPNMIEFVRSEIMDIQDKITWDDIAGLKDAKIAIQEAVVWPLLRPDIFRGLRRPPKGILLFGPPGTGKTLIGKCIASQSKSTFFSISASSITSKWIGDGEKMVRALFAVARCHQPAVIFIDEVDSLLSQRSETEHESSRRIKTEFLIQLDGATTGNEDRILLIGATNRPQELDEAARRRFSKRLYVPLPDYPARLELLRKLLASERNNLSEKDLEEVSRLSEGFSGADLRNLCSEAALEPIRSVDIGLLGHIDATEVRPVVLDDFMKSLRTVRASVSPSDLNHYIEWNKTYGSGK